jgi:hypothetical protein
MILGFYFARLVPPSRSRFSNPSLFAVAIAASGPPHALCRTENRQERAG